MGLILDSSVGIASERRGLTVADLVASLRDRIGPNELLAVSVLTVMEIAHGIARADTPERHARRSRFLADLLQGMYVCPVTAEIAHRAGLLDGFLKAAGTSIAVTDLLIGATALELGYSVLTHNVRHFRSIPGLVVEQV